MASIVMAFIISATYSHACVEGEKSMSSTAAGTVTTSIHRTAAATERINNLWCYYCHSMDSGESCIDVSQNNSATIRKCEGEEFICTVTRFSYTTSTENSTSLPRMWSLARNCSISCEPGCIIIGERTKLYACTSCCEESFCNTGRGAASRVYDRVEATGIGTRIWLVFLLPHLWTTYHQ